MNRFSLAVAVAVASGTSLILAADSQPAPATSARSARAPASTNKSPAAVAALIRDEEMNRGQIADIFGYLTDVIGARLTGSPNCRRANEWTRDKLASWGLTNAHLEAWGPFGRGWAVKRFSAQIVEPQAIPLVGWPKAWSCGIERSIEAEVVYLDASTDAEFESFKGKLKDCIVLISAPREVPVHFEPLATRIDETNLLRLANLSPAARGGPMRPEGDARRPAFTNRPPAMGMTNAFSRAGTNFGGRFSRTNAPGGGPGRSFRGMDSMSRLRFAVREGAAATVSISAAGDGGALSVGEATVVAPASGGTNRSSSSSFVRAWATNAPVGPPQIVVAAEQYNRLVHMVQAGEKVKMALEVQTEFFNDLMCYNTIAEIPGTDLKKEIVMLGAHVDSMPAGTGATDNGAGVAVCLEAVRLLEALNLQPRRTIRIGLWTGEEQGLLGSRAYVAKQFGYFTNQVSSAALRSPKDTTERTASSTTNASQRTLFRFPEYERMSAYYNLDNGAGQIRGIYLQGNEPLRSIFRPWLVPFYDLGAETITASLTGSTDHASFEAIGLPGFQFLQDSVEYWRSYHNSLDVRERAPISDLQQAAMIMAAFVYNTAMLDETLPRKPLEIDSAPRRF